MNLFKTLIIEDSFVFRLAFKRVLSAKFPAMEIAEAVDGEEALEKVTSFRPNLIFLDVKLPDGNGLELTRKIKAANPSITILVLTSYDIPE
jgi:DNA-binding NarL/FixJ family response regulator